MIKQQKLKGIQAKRVSKGTRIRQEIGIGRIRKGKKTAYCRSMYSKKVARTHGTLHLSTITPGWRKQTRHPSHAQDVVRLSQRPENRDHGSTILIDHYVIGPDFRARLRDRAEVEDHARARHIPSQDFVLRLINKHATGGHSRRKTPAESPRLQQPHPPPLLSRNPMLTARPAST